MISFSYNFLELFLYLLTVISIEKANIYLNVETIRTRGHVVCPK